MSQRVPVPGSKQATIVEQKQHFLQTRKHILSRGIPPSERLRTLAQDGGIELSVMKGVLDKGNFLIPYPGPMIKTKPVSSQP